MAEYVEYPPEQRRLRELPPRKIDWFTQSTILFGGFFQQFGWIFFGFGMIFFWVFGWNSEARYWLSNIGKWSDTEGLIILSEQTNAAQNDVLIYKYVFQYEVEGKRYLGKAYQSGDRYFEGSTYPVRYKVSDPSLAFIKGSRRAMFGGWAMFVAIFPLVGLLFILSSLRNNAKFLDLLKIGEFTRGKMISKEPTGGEVIINKVRYPIFKYTFEFTYKDQQHLATCTTHLGHTVEDENEEIILFDRFNPGYNIVYDVVPNAPRIDREGYMEIAGWRKAWVLLLPFVSVTGHGIWAWQVF